MRAFCTTGTKSSSRSAEYEKEGEKARRRESYRSLQRAPFSAKDRASLQSVSLTVVKVGSVQGDFLKLRDHERSLTGTEVDFFNLSTKQICENSRALESTLRSAQKPPIAALKKSEEGQTQTQDCHLGRFMLFNDLYQRVERKESGQGQSSDLNA